MNEMHASRYTSRTSMLVRRPHDTATALVSKLMCLADTKLADRTSSIALKQPASALTSPQIAEASKVRSSTPTKGRIRPSSKEPEQSLGDDVVSLRADLATTQKARTALQAQVDELTTTLKGLELQSKTSMSQITQLSRQKMDSEKRLRDRDEELRGKSKLAEDAQDEMVALGLQLNIAEQKQEKAERENKELTERWMKRMGEEADQMNRESRWE